MEAFCNRDVENEIARIHRLSHKTPSICQRILLAKPSKYTQNLITSLTSTTISIFVQATTVCLCSCNKFLSGFILAPFHAFILISLQTLQHSSQSDFFKRLIIMHHSAIQQSRAVHKALCSIPQCLVLPPTTLYPCLLCTCCTGLLTHSQSCQDHFYFKALAFAVFSALACCSSG